MKRSARRVVNRNESAGAVIGFAVLGAPPYFRIVDRASRSQFRTISAPGDGNFGEEVDAGSVGEQALARKTRLLPSTTEPDFIAPVLRLVPEAIRRPQVRNNVVPPSPTQASCIAGVGSFGIL